MTNKVLSSLLSFVAKKVTQIELRQYLECALVRLCKINAFYNNWGVRRCCIKWCLYFFNFCCIPSRWRALLASCLLLHQLPIAVWSNRWITGGQLPSCAVTDINYLCYHQHRLDSNFVCLTMSISARLQHIYWKCIQDSNWNGLIQKPCGNYVYLMWVLLRQIKKIMFLIFTNTIDLILDYQRGRLYDIILCHSNSTPGSFASSVGFWLWYEQSFVFLLD